MRIVEDTPERLVLRSSRRGAYVASAVLFAVAGGLAATADALFVACDRGKDRCTFESVGLLQGEHRKTVTLSEVARWTSGATATRSGTSRVSRRAQHGVVLLDGRRIQAEPRARTVLFDDGVEARFRTFQRGDAPSLELTAVHFGEGGLFVLLCLAIGGVVVMMAQGGELRFDRATGRVRGTVRGIRPGSHDLEAPLDQLEAVETCARGTTVGSYLALRDGRRLRFEAGPTTQLAALLAQRLQLPMRPVDPAAIVAAGAGRSIVPSIAVLGLSLGPALLALLWGLFDK